MAREFEGKETEAKGLYGKIVSGFPQALQAKKASGAIRRLECVGKPIPLKGVDLAGKAGVEIVSGPVSDDMATHRVAQQGEVAGEIQHLVPDKLILEPESRVENTILTQDHGIFQAATFD